MALLWHKKAILITTCVLICSGQSQGRKQKKEAIEDIIKKVYNLTSQSLKNANSKDKDEILRKIQSKLIKSAEPLGSKADKYVQLIMQGLQIMANNQTHQDNVLETITSDNSMEINLRSNNNNNSNTKHRSKDFMAKMIAYKILKLADKYYQKAETTGENQQNLIENIKKRILEKAKEKQDKIHARHDEIKKYTNLITRGMELMMQKMSQDKRRMVMKFIKSNIQSQHDDGVNFATKNKHKMVKESDSDNDLNQLEKNDPTERTLETSGLTTPFACDDVFQQTCKEIKSLNQFKCLDKGSTLPLNKLCDGIMDCGDGSDEGNCINQARKRLQTAVQLMSRIEIYLLRNCFLTDDNSLLVKQNAVLYDVLQKQIGFIDKYKNGPPNHNQFRDAFNFKATINEVAVVINTLAVALDSSLCSRYMNKKKIKADGRKFNPFEVDDLDELTAKPMFKVSLKRCKCKGSFCANTTCPGACKGVCWHKYNMGRWACQAVDEGTSVPLDVVCDGKLDCYDETDELDCVSGSSKQGNNKFEANDFFQKVLTMIYAKSNSKEYSVVRVKLLSLANTIKELQKVVMKSNIDVANIKRVRDICFTSILSIYEDILGKAVDVEELEAAQLFLLNVNEMLMAALKRSHTGNDKIISPDGCYCRGSQCASNQCTKTCKRACAAGPKLSRYWCKGVSNNNISVPLEAVCNGKPNCPFEDDEAQCSKEICRRHHLVLLRHNIRDVGDKHKGTSLGETLLTWKAKVTSTLKVAENNYRPTPTTLRDLVAGLLRDLVMMYASMDESRRSNTGYVFKEFYTISQILIDILKSCGK